MTSEEFVKKKYPRAVVESYKQNGPLGKRYYLCWSKSFNGIRLSEGDTKSKAWVNAKKNIINKT